MITRKQKNGYYETEKDGKNIDELIESIKERMCDKYCKYPNECDDGDEMIDTICVNCPLSEL